MSNNISNFQIINSAISVFRYRPNNHHTMKTTTQEEV